MIKLLSIAVLCIALLFGCAVLDPKATPVEKAYSFVTMYNSQYEDYLRQEAKPNLTPQEKEILLAKREILIVVDPLVKAYGAWATGKRVIDADMVMELEAEIIQLLNKTLLDI